MKNYPAPEIRQFGELLMSHMASAHAQKHMGGLGGCKTFDIESYPVEFRPYILAYLEGGADSLAITYAAMRTKENEKLVEVLRSIANNDGIVVMLGAQAVARVALEAYCEDR
jgi:hypothetical protein